MVRTASGSVEMVKRLPPVPLDALWDHSLWDTLDAAGAGCLLRLIKYYWTSGRPIPTNNAALMQICRCYGGTWAKHKADVMTIWGDIFPALEAHRKLKKQQAEGLRDVLRLAGQISAGKRARRKLVEGNQQANVPVYASGVLPKREAEFVLKSSEIRRNRWEQHLINTGQKTAPEAKPAPRRFTDRG
jgi:uncharacterized protein YdaU (DUF1376 family)